MARALSTLLGGVLLVLVGAALLTPGASVASTGFALVLLTVAAGAVVMAVVVRRSAMRDEARRVDALGRDHDPATTDPDGAVTPPTDEEHHRG